MGVGIGIGRRGGGGVPKSARLGGLDGEREFRLYGFCLGFGMSMWILLWVMNINAYFSKYFLFKIISKINKQH